MQIDLVNKVLLFILLCVFIACIVLMVTNNKNTPSHNVVEGFFSEDPLMEKLNTYFPDITNEERDTMYADLKKELDDTCKSDLEKDFDINNWVPKTNIPPAGPRIDMSQYIPKSAVPPEKICPPQKEIDYSEYVKKSTLPPAMKCPACISPKVKVSAGLCKKCPPCPACPPPKPCPRVECPEPVPCPKVECPKCSEIKYIKVPTIITRTIKVDSSNNVVSEEVEETGNNANTTTTAPSLVNSVSSLLSQTNATPETTPETTLGEITTTTIPIATRNANKEKQSQCSTVGLNSDFKSFGIYGL